MNERTHGRFVQRHLRVLAGVGVLQVHFVEGLVDLPIEQLDEALRLLEQRAGEFVAFGRARGAVRAGIGGEN